MTSPSPVAVRQPRDPAEVQAIIERWLEDFRKSPWAGVIANNLYQAAYRDTIVQLLARGAKLYVLCNAEHPGQSLGWACTEADRDGEPVLHYVFLKATYRKRGLAGTLLRALGFDPQKRAKNTFQTGLGKAKLRGLDFRPDIARRKLA